MPRPRLDHVRKAQILSAAAEVLSQRGYANARVVDIAKTAGTSPAAILYWFDGKDGLLAEALRLREQEFHDRYTVKAEQKASASDQLRVLIEAMLHHYDCVCSRCATKPPLRNATVSTVVGERRCAPRSARVSRRASSCPATPRK
jgi:AcrR family transcriptional regulator